MLLLFPIIRQMSRNELTSPRSFWYSGRNHVMVNSILSNDSNKSTCSRVRLISKSAESHWRIQLDLSSTITVIPLKCGRIRRINIGHPVAIWTRNRGIDCGGDWTTSASWRAVTTSGAVIRLLAVRLSPNYGRSWSVRRRAKWFSHRFGYCPLSGGGNITVSFRCGETDRSRPESGIDVWIDFTVFLTFEKRK